MRPYDEIPFEESDYSDVALLVASVREWPSEDFARELDARVAQRFATEAAPHASHIGRGRLSRWTVGPAAALTAAAATAVVVLSSGGGGLVAGSGALASRQGAGRVLDHGRQNIGNLGAAKRSAARGTSYRNLANKSTPTGAPLTTAGAAALPTATSTTPANVPNGQSLDATAGRTRYGAKHAAAGTANTQAIFGAATNQSLAPVAPGNKQIQAAQISLTTPNDHVDQVATEVYTVVGAVHGSVLSSHVTSATSNSGGGYASFALSIPTSNLQEAMTQLSRLHYAAVSSRTDASQNVSGQYNNIQRQLADAKALRASLLKQLQTAYTQQAIDSIKAQLKLAEQEINSWQSALNSLNRKITYSDVSVQINAGGLPVRPVAHHNNSFTIGRAAHDALHVLVVSAGVALIALAVAIPVGLVAALLMWLWVWLRQRRREHALDATA